MKNAIGRPGVRMCWWQLPLVLLPAFELALAAPGTATYEYDDAGRLTKADLHDGTEVTYTLDDAGNRESVSAVVPVTFSIGNAQANEGASIVFTVTKTGTNTANVTVDYATAPGTATSADFAAKSGTLTFAPADTSKTISVSTSGQAEAIYEDDETFTLTLSNPGAGGALGTAVGTGTIQNDDPAPYFTVNDVSVSEGGNLSFTVTKTGATAFSHQVKYKTNGGNATPGADFTAVPDTTLTFSSGTTTQSAIVDTLEDTIYEPNQTVTVTLSGATNGATINDANGTGTINEDADAPPSFAILNASVSEGGTLNFTVEKNGATEFTHAVNYATGTTGTATSGTDFTAESSQLSFVASEDSLSITIATAEEATCEGNETVPVTLSAPTNNATLADASGTGTINNDDVPPAPNPITPGFQYITQPTQFANFQWTAPGTCAPTSYELYRSLSGGPGGSLKYNGPNTNASVGGTGEWPSSGTYTFTARACNSIGCGVYTGNSLVFVQLGPEG